LKKELRRELRQDELVSGYERARAWLDGHVDEIRIGVVAVVVLAIGGGALWHFRTTRQRDAEVAFAEALDIFKAPVTAGLPPGTQKPAGVSFSTSEEKFTKAVAAFDGVDRRFGSSPLGRRARYYAAISRIELGQYAEAQKALGELATRRSDGDTEAGLARLALAGLFRKSGELEKAIDTYRQLISDPGAGVPRDVALMSLAGTLEDSRKLAEARASYLKLGEDFPASVLADEARRRAEYLETATQG
jgi:hypothetical protein